MRRWIFPVAFVLLSLNVLAWAQGSSQDECGAFREVQAAVSRLLSHPGYTESDEHILNRAGDMAAVAILRSVSVKDFNSFERTEPILLALNIAFAAPQLIAAESDRRPTAALLLLDYLQRTYVARGASPNEIENTRLQIEHNTTTGKPTEFVSLEGAPPIDREHTLWVNSVLSWTLTIRPGMTRKDLLKVYTTEGGLSTRTNRTYVLEQCPYIKVDVEFSPVGKPNDPFGQLESSNDRILRISKPYLQYTIAD